MALTISEQLSIINGVETPTTNTLEDLVAQIALNEAQSFHDNVKSFDGDAKPLADTYKRKMLVFADQIIQNTVNTAKLVKLLVAIYADTGTITEVQSATDEQWVTFLENNITKTFELTAGVRNAEKTDYDGI